LKAALEGVLAIPLDTPGVIVSDSQYMVRGCTEWRSGWQKRGMKGAGGKPVVNPDLWVRLWEALDARPQVRLEWTRAHVGTEENERVDTLARDAATKVRDGGPPLKEETMILAAAA
jgi:ribonuclease HI